LHRPAKTSALTAILSPAAVVFAVLGLILAVVGLKMAKKPGVTGKGVAIDGLVSALLGLILGGVVIGGLAVVVNNKTQLDRIQHYIDDARAKLPTPRQVARPDPICVCTAPLRRGVHHTLLVH